MWPAVCLWQCRTWRSGRRLCLTKPRIWLSSKVSVCMLSSWHYGGKAMKKVREISFLSPISLAVLVAEYFMLNIMSFVTRSCVGSKAAVWHLCPGREGSLFREGLPANAAVSCRLLLPPNSECHSWRTEVWFLVLIPYICKTPYWVSYSTSTEVLLTVKRLRVLKTPTLSVLITTNTENWILAPDKHTTNSTVTRMCSQIVWLSYRKYEWL